MKKIFISFVVGLFTLGVGFSKPPKLLKPKKNGEWIEPYKPIAPNIIYGNWNWLETDCCGSRHGLSNPSSTNDNIELEINKDYSFMEVHSKPNALPRNGHFTLFQDGQKNMIQFNDERPAQYTLSPKGDTLTISWKYLELQTERYLRK